MHELTSIEKKIPTEIVISCTLENRIVITKADPTYNVFVVKRLQKAFIDISKSKIWRESRSCHGIGRLISTTCTQWDDLI